jgi:hypothetical protein
MTSCGTTQTSPSLTGLTGLKLPGPGTYAIRVWLADQLGHENPAGAAAIALTYEEPQAGAPGDRQSQPDHPADPQPEPQLPTDVAPPPPLASWPTAKADSRLRLTTVRRTGRRVTVAGRISPKASGRVTVRYRLRLRGRTHSHTKRAAIAKGTFRCVFVLPRALASHAAAAIISATYGGDADTRRGTARRGS